MSKKDYRRDRTFIIEEKEIYDCMTFLEIKNFNLPDNAWFEVEKEYEYDDCFVKMFIRWSREETDEEYNARMTELDKLIEKEKIKKAKYAEAQKKRNATLAEKEKKKAEEELKKIRAKFPDLF